MSFMLLQLFTGELPQEVGRLARLAGGGEDGAIVLFQKRQPIIDVRGVAELAVYAEVGAEERRGQLRDQFLGGIRARTESIFQVAIEAGLVSAPVAELVNSPIGQSEEYGSRRTHLGSARELDLRLTLLL